MFCSYFISLSTQGYRLPCVQLLRTLGPYQNYLLNANNQKNSIFFRPLFSALVALLRFACLSRRIGTAESLNSVCASVSCRNWEKSDHAIYFEKNLVKSKCFPKFPLLLWQVFVYAKNQMSALWIIVQWSSAEEKSTIERIHGKWPVFLNSCMKDFFLKVQECHNDLTKSPTNLTYSSM